MPRWSRRRHAARRSSRRNSATPLVLLTVLVVLLLLILDGRVIKIPHTRINLPQLPSISIPVTGLPRIEIPNVEIPVTLVPGTLVPDIQIGGTPVPPGSPALGQRTKQSGCQLRGSLPDPACTPGSVLTSSTTVVCQPNYSTSVRDVPQDLKEAVYTSYGIPSRVEGQYQIDHLIPLSAGGSNDISNLWPSPASPSPGYAEKDRLEIALREEVCSGKIALPEAQRQIAANWVDLYDRLVR